MHCVNKYNISGNSKGLVSSSFSSFLFFSTFIFCVVCLIPLMLFVCLLMEYASIAALFVKSINKTLLLIASVYAFHCFLIGVLYIISSGISLINSSRLYNIYFSVGIPVFLCL